MTHVYLLKATTSADFDEPEMLGVGKTEDAVKAWLQKCLEASWKKMDGDSQEFYQNFDAYYDSWYIEVWPFIICE